MSTSLLQIIINHTKKNIGKLITTEQIVSLQKTVLSENRNHNKLYKLVHTLKTKGHIIELRKGLYYCNYPESGITVNQLLDQRYWPILHDLIQKTCKAQYMIGGINGLEIHFGQYNISNDINVINNKTSGQSTIIQNHEVQWKLIDTNKTSKKANLVKLLEKEIMTVTIGGKLFRIAPLELCILDSLYYTKKTNGYEYELIKKILKKIKYNINRDIIKLILTSGKYHTSFDRLTKIAPMLDQKFSLQCIAFQKLYSFRL